MVKKNSGIVDYMVDARAVSQARVRPYKRDPRGPQHRPLRIYTLDPSVSDRLGGVATVQVPYEKLEHGPIGSLFEIRTDTAPEEWRTEALNLDDPHLLLSSGLSPTPANGKFHPQMVYAVCSLTYAAFKRALGREIAWAIPSRGDDIPLRLLVRPFIEGENAGYSREGGCLMFGYFQASERAAGFTLKGGLISTALSHDVIAHETTHALLDGLRSSFSEPTNVDVPAFHEGFSDLVALFLHFTYPTVVEHAIRDSRGTLSHGSLLTDIAREFGYARERGNGEALRSGIDVKGLAAFDSDIVPSEGGPTKYDPDLEHHKLGSVLVSAVFEAFATIVRRKTHRLFRIAGLDPNLLGQVSLSDPLVEAIAQEASEIASQFLNICIRAIDYCPPVDIELGEYLRALITADSDMERIDKWGYREALMRSFLRRHIFPKNVKFMTEDAVRWGAPEKPLNIPELAFSQLRFDGEPGRPANAVELQRQADALGTFVTRAENAKHFGLVAPSARRSKKITQVNPVSVQSIRVARRSGPDGRVMFDVVGELTQSCTITESKNTYEVFGGCTVLIDPEGNLRYAIGKRFNSGNRSELQLQMMRGPLKAFWKLEKGRWKKPGEVWRLLHAKR